MINKWYKLLFLLPFVLLGIKCIELLRFSPNVPFWDDWFIIYRGWGEFNIEHLFYGKNDTIAPLPIFIDSLFFHLIGSNFTVLQFLTLSTTFILIFFSYFYIAKKLNLSFISLIFFIISLLFMLQVDSYWGLQFIAYHQVIPIVAIIIMIAYSLKINTSEKKTIIVMSLFGCCAGFSYISGSVATLILALTNFIFYFFINCQKSLSKRIAISSFISTVVTLPFHLYVLLFTQGLKTHKSTPWSFPWEWEFWAFTIGLIQRVFRVSWGYFSLDFSQELNLLKLPVIVLVIFFLLTPLFITLSNILKKQKINDFEIISISMLLVGLGYITILAAGRTFILGTNINNDWGTYFGIGQSGFYYTWVSIILPFVVIYWICFLKFSKKIFRFSLYFFIFMMMLNFILSGGFNFKNDFKKKSDRISTGYTCIVEALAFDLNQIYCPTLGGGNLRPIINKIYKLETDFTQDLKNDVHNLKRIILKTQLSNKKWKKSYEINIKHLINIDGDLNERNGYIYFRPVSNRNLIINLENLNSYERNCGKSQGLKLEGTIFSSKRDTVLHVFFDPNSVNEIDNNVLGEIYKANEYHNFSLEMVSEDGFNTNLIISPGEFNQTYKLKNIKLYCR